MKSDHLAECWHSFVSSSTSSVVTANNIKNKKKKNKERRRRIRRGRRECTWEESDQWDRSSLERGRGGPQWSGRCPPEPQSRAVPTPHIYPFQNGYLIHYSSYSSYSPFSHLILICTLRSIICYLFLASSLFLLFLRLVVSICSFLFPPSPFLLSPFLLL